MRYTERRIDDSSIMKQLGQTYKSAATVIAESVTRSDVTKGNGKTPTPYVCTVIRSQPMRLSGKSWQTELADWNCSMGVPTHRPTGLGGPSTIRGRALNGAISNVKAQKVNLAMAFAQRKQSLSLIRDMTLQIGKGLSAAARRDWKALARVTGIATTAKSNKSKDDLILLLKRNGKNISGKHLATVFGLMPLISDVQGMIAEVMADERPLEFVAKGRYKTSRVVTAKVPQPWRFFVPGYNGTPESIQPWGYTTMTTEKKISCRAFLRYQVESAALRDLSRLGISNPAYVIWDSVPYSFVIDWVINIGSWLNGLDYDAGLVYMGGCFSEITHESTISTRPSLTLTEKVGQPPVNKTLISASYTHGAHESKKFERTLIVDKPSVTLAFKNPFSVFTALASAALIGQMMDTRKKLSPPKFSYKRPRVKNLKPINYR